MLVTDFDYELSRDLIAQYPPKKRGEARLLILNREAQTTEHCKFYNIADYLRKGDVLVLNETKVIPARLIGRRVDTGGKVEIFLIKPVNSLVLKKQYSTRQESRGFWEVLISPGRAKKIGIKVEFGPDLWGEVIDSGRVGNAKGCERSEQGFAREHPVFRFHFKDGNENFNTLFHKYGQIPLPPYIKRPPVADDCLRYQTVYSNVPGACAAPTAGLHFTQEMLDELRDHGIEIVRLILHTGVGTFKPMKCEKVGDHLMEPEYYEIPDEVVAKIGSIKDVRHGRGWRELGGSVGGFGGTGFQPVKRHSQDGCATRAKGPTRIVAVGTTTVRALESMQELKACKGWTNKFIYPPYKFKWVDALITNFHLPKSTLLLLVCAFAGRENIFKTYKEAIKLGYKFYSYGDAMLIQ